MHGSHAAAGFAAYDTMRRAEAYSRHPLEAQDSLVLHNSLAASPASVALEHQVITFKFFILSCVRYISGLLQDYAKMNKPDGVCVS